MRTWPVGTKIYIVSNTNDHNYTVGKAYVIAEVDTDGTLKARDPETKVVGNWLRWVDVDTVAPIGWNYCKRVLSSETVAFLSAFLGIENIVLRNDVKNRLLQNLPNLYDSILATVQESEARAKVTVLRAVPTTREAVDDDDDDDVIESDEHGPE